MLERLRDVSGMPKEQPRLASKLCPVAMMTLHEVEEIWAQFMETAVTVKRSVND